MTVQKRRVVAGSVGIGVLFLSLIAGTVWWSLDAGRRGEEKVPGAGEPHASSDVSLDTTQGGGRITVGGGSSPSSLVLGELLRQTLIEEGYLIVDLVGMETPGHIRQALADTDIDLVWCAAAPESASSADIVALPTRVFAGWRVIVSERLASQLSQPTLSALSTACEPLHAQIRSAAAEPFSVQILDHALLQEGTLLCIDEGTPVFSLAEAETQLKLTRVDLAVVPRLEETLTVAGFIPLEDDLGVLPQQPVSMIVRRSLLERDAELEPLLRSLGEHTTTEIIHHLVTQVRLLQRDVEDVVREYLTSLPPSA